MSAYGFPLDWDSIINEGYSIELDFGLIVCFFTKKHIEPV